jgi:hypothetical protein
MYILNVGFKFDDTDGLFAGDDPNPNGLDPDLRRSMDWLELVGAEPPNPNPPAFNPDTRNWTRLGSTVSLLIPSFLGAVPDPANIGIRIVPDSRGPTPSAAAVLTLAVTFGRPARRHQPQSSPFTHNGQPPLLGGRVIPTFVRGPVARNAGLGWFFHLGTVAIRPGAGGPKKTHRYEFAIGVNITDGPTERSYGEDPEMDIGE